MYMLKYSKIISQAFKIIIRESELAAGRGVVRDNAKMIAETACDYKIDAILSAQKPYFFLGLQHHKEGEMTVELAFGKLTFKLEIQEHLAEVESRTKGSGPRPRTQKISEAKAKDSPSEDRPSRGQGQECSRPRPRTKDTGASVLQKKKSSKTFFRRSPFHWRTQNF